MSHNNPSKEIGTQWEVDSRDYLRYAHGFRDLERLPLSGRRDVGDLGGIEGFLISCKNEKTIRLSTYLDDLQRMKGNLTGGRDVVPVVLVKRRGKGPGRAYVVVELDEFAPLMRAVAGE